MATIRFELISFYDINIPVLSRKHQRTLEVILRRPTAASVKYTDFAALVRAVGGEIEERAGSRVAAILNGRVLVLHRPHPGNELRRYAVEDVRDFLTAAGVTQ